MVSGQYPETKSELCKCIETFLYVIYETADNVFNTCSVTTANVIEKQFLPALMKNRLFEYVK